MAGKKTTRGKDSKCKKRIFDIIQIGSQVDVASKIFDVFIVIMIITSITMTFMQTFDELDPYDHILNKIELFTIVVFIIEYLLRIYTSDLLYPEESRGRAIWSFMTSFYGLVDLLTILSYFMELDSNGIVAFRMIRAVRILRLFKVNTSSDAFNVVAGVLKERKNQILSSIFMIAMLIMASSLCMYGFEHDVQPEVFNNAFSGIWWAMSTVLTIGYGDIYPVTIGGRIIAIVIALLGVCAVAIPTGVISAGFVEYYARLKRDEGEIRLSPDVNELLQQQANKAGLREDTYVEHLILEKEKERREKMANGRNGKKQK